MQQSASEPASLQWGHKQLYNIEKDMCKRIRQGKKDLVGELQVQGVSTEH